MKGKFLITTDNWFYAPDGKKYKAVWGNLKVLEDNILGIKTNRNASNWFAKIGSEDNFVIVAGCQIHYAVKSNKMPNENNVDDICYDASNFTKFSRPNEIYIAE